MKVINLNPQFAPAFIQYAFLELRQGNLDHALGLSRRAEQLEPARAGYHILSGHTMLQLGRIADAAMFARYVADGGKAPTTMKPWSYGTRFQTHKDRKTFDWRRKSL